MGDTGSAPDQSWLQNSSFNITLQALSVPPSSTINARAPLLELAGSSSSSEDEAHEEQHKGASQSSPGSNERVGQGSKSQEHGKRARESQHRKEQKHRKKHKKDKRRNDLPKGRRKTDDEKIAKLEVRAQRSLGNARRGKPMQWVGDEVTARDAFFVDSSGDRDNLTFGGLYKMDIAAFRAVKAPGMEHIYRQRTGYAARPIGGEVDDENQRQQNRRTGKVQRRRYFLASVHRRGSDRSRKRLHIVRVDEPNSSAPVRPPRLALLTPTFIPVAPVKEEQAPTGSTVHTEDDGEGETGDQYLMRRVREFNVAIRERPHELQLWLDFAAFQDEATELSHHSQGRGKAATAEKKVAILEKALEFHPGSERLLLALLDSAEQNLLREEFGQRWKAVLSRHSGSVRLWRQYLAWQAGHADSFSASSLRESYNDALQALARERLRRLREGAPVSIVDETEQGMVGLLVDACRLDLQTGHSEVGVARIQATLEFLLYSPALPTIVPGPGGDAARQSLFSEFWSSSAPMVGEEGSQGWGQWAVQRVGGLPHQEDEPAAPSEEPEEEEAGGWSGWVPLAPEGSAQDGSEADVPQQDAAETDSSDDEEEADIPLGGSQQTGQEQPETEEELVERLRQQIEEHFQDIQKTEGIDESLFQDWLALERQRERQEWQPIRTSAPVTAMRSASEPDSGSEADGKDEEDKADSLWRVAFETVRAGTFSLVAEEARQDLVLQLLELLDTPLEPWRSSNSEAAERAAATSASLPPYLADVVLTHTMQPPLGNVGLPLSRIPEPSVSWLSPNNVGLEDNAAAQPGVLLWFQADESRRQFLARLLTQLMESGPLRFDTRLCNALMLVEAAPVLSDPDAGQLHPAAAGPRVPNYGRARAAARQLLARHRDSMELWGAYGFLEIMAGSMKATRKVYNNILATVHGSAETMVHRAQLAFAYARAELQSQASNARILALHIVTWLGAGGPFSPPQATDLTFPADSRLLAARRGFQAELPRVLSGAQAGPNRAQAAVISAAALFEELADLGTGTHNAHGTVAAANILQHVLAAWPLDVRKGSVVLEGLQQEYCQLLVGASAHSQSGVTPGRARKAVVDALQVYPRSARLVELLAVLEQRAHTLSRLRVFLRSACEQHASLALWLLALKHEAGLPGSMHRVQGLLQRAARSPQLQGCALVRRISLAYELSHDRKTRAEEVFLRGITACPWAKELLLDGLSQLNTLKPALRGGLLEKAAEQELRLRTTVGEVQYAAAAGRVRIE